MGSDFFQHGLRVLQHLSVLEPKDGQTLRSQGNVTFPIEFPPFLGVVGVAIAFDDQLGLVTVKVADVVTELMIASKLRIPELPVSQQLPQELFGFGFIFSQLTRPLLQS